VSIVRTAPYCLNGPKKDRWFGLDRTDDSCLDAAHGVKGLDRYAAAKPPLTPWAASKSLSSARSRPCSRPQVSTRRIESTKRCPNFLIQALSSVVARGPLARCDPEGGTLSVSCHRHRLFAERTQFSFCRTKPIS